jgi:ATP-dependent Lon protease
MPIGGLREKVMAAKIAGVGRVLIPRLNQRDLADVPAPIKQGIEFELVDHMDRVIEIALAPRPPKPRPRRPPTPRRRRVEAGA